MSRKGRARQGKGTARHGANDSTGSFNAVSGALRHRCPRRRSALCQEQALGTRGQRCVHTVIDATPVGVGRKRYAGHGGSVVGRHGWRRVVVPGETLFRFLKTSQGASGPRQTPRNKRPLRHERAVGDHSGHGGWKRARPRCRCAWVCRALPKTHGLRLLAKNVRPGAWRAAPPVAHQRQ